MPKKKTNSINIFKIFIQLLLSVCLILIIIILLIFSFGLGMKTAFKIKDREVSYCVWKDKKTIYCKTEQGYDSFYNKKQNNNI